MRCLLLGRDHSTYGIVTTTAAGTTVAASISVGSDPQSPGLEFKGDSDTPNEDALCVVDNGDLVAMVVADAHFGDESSASLVERAHQALLDELPRTPAMLSEMIASLGRDPQPESRSESTLVVAVVDRSSGEGFATSFGDSTLALVTKAGEYRGLNNKDRRYVAAGSRWLGYRGSPCAFSTSPGDTLLLFTDGVDECHYGYPATSVGVEHIVEVVGGARGRADLIAGRLARLALQGIDGNPGGQDNIAIIALRA